MMIRRDPLEVICSSLHPKQGLPLTPHPPCHFYIPYLRCPATVEGGQGKSEVRLQWSLEHAVSQVGIEVVLQQVKLIVFAFASSVQPCWLLPDCLGLEVRLPGFDAIICR